MLRMDHGDLSSRFLQKLLLLLLLVSSIIHQVASIGITLPPVRLKDLKKGNKNCLRYKAPIDELVVIRLNAGEKIEDQSLNLRVFGSDETLYRTKDNLQKKIRVAFTTTTNDYFDICFENYMLDSSWSKYGTEKQILLDVEIGHKARDKNAYQRTEKYSPILKELTDIDTLHSALQLELATLVQQETQLRNINENSQDSHLKYQVLIIVILVTAGICQLFYFRFFLKTKKLFWWSEIVCQQKWKPKRFFHPRLSADFIFMVAFICHPRVAAQNNPQF